MPEILQPGDLLVLNDTRVTAIRLHGRKETGAAVEAVLLRERGPRIFEALVRPGRRLQPGTRVAFGEGLQATVGEALEAGLRLVAFEPVPDLAQRLREVGTIPLPPYVREAIQDAERYQTVYAREGGSAAAPTAGLHFTPEILRELESKGVRIATVTLDIGLDTFRPVEADDLSEHQMHGERCTLPPETARAIEECRGRVIAVGTTAVRTLETCAIDDKRTRPGSETSTLFIRPGYKFRIVEGMFTNLHMPRTTMLMMISALAGRESVMRAYAQALDEGYRFLSFGDAMLIL